MDEIPSPGHDPIHPTRDAGLPTADGRRTSVTPIASRPPIRGRPLGTGGVRTRGSKFMVTSGEDPVCLSYRGVRFVPASPAAGGSPGRDPCVPIARRRPRPSRWSIRPPRPPMRTIGDSSDSGDPAGGGVPASSARRLGYLDSWRDQRSRWQPLPAPGWSGRRATMSFRAAGTNPVTGSRESRATSGRTRRRRSGSRTSGCGGWSVSARGRAGGPC